MIDRVSELVFIVAKIMSSIQAPKVFDEQMNAFTDLFPTINLSINTE